MVNSNKKFLLRLKKRRDFLASRTSENPNLSYDLAELSALTWAIDTLKELLVLDDGFNIIKQDDDNGVIKL